MTDDYDPAADGRKSYEAAIEAKRLRGDTHDWEGMKGTTMSGEPKVLLLREKRHRRPNVFPKGGAVGVSPAKAAREFGITLKLMRRAIVSGDVKTISFGGGMYIPHGEIARLKKLFEQGEQP